MRREQPRWERVAAMRRQGEREEREIKKRQNFAEVYLRWLSGNDVGRAAAAAAIVEARKRRQAEVGDG